MTPITSSGSSAPSSEHYRPDRGLTEVVRQRAESAPDAPYLQDADGDRLTYGQAWHAIERWARGFVASRVARGEAVAVVRAVSADTICAWLGLARIGAVEVPVNTAYHGPLLRHVLADSGARVVVVAAEHLSAVLEVVPSLPAVELVVVDAEAPSAGDPGIQIQGVAQFLSAGDGVALPDRAPQARETACVLYTSGTTGPPKGALVSWGQLYATAVGLPVHGELGHDDCYYSPFPAFHIGGKHPPYLMALAGGRVVLKDRFRTQDFWDDVRRYGCTVTFLLSAMSQFLLERPVSEVECGPPLRLVMVVPMPADPVGFERRFGVRLSTIFNMTEISVPIRSRPGELHHSSSCGFIRPGYQARIVNDEDVEVPDGSVGELVLRSDLPWVHSTGYWNAPDKTAESWRNLWFHTGDAFRRDPDGSFHFVDRKKDVIRRRGENISSAVVEAACAELDSVRACAVVGVPSQYGEEEVLLSVVPAPSGFDVNELVYELRQRLPAFMVPAYVDVVDELPMTPTQKVRKAELRARGVTEGTHVVGPAGRDR